MKEASNTATENPLKGVWLSDYTYHSSGRDATFQSKHYVRLYPKGGELVVETVGDQNESYLVARFWLDGEVATGSWQEVTAQDGYYKGAIYHGAAQLIIDKDRKHIAGKWVGFGKNMDVKTGPWEFTYLGEDESAIPKDAQNAGR